MTKMTPRTNPTTVAKEVDLDILVAPIVITIWLEWTRFLLVLLPSECNNFASFLNSLNVFLDFYRNSL